MLTIKLAKFLTLISEKEKIPCFQRVGRSYIIISLNYLIKRHHIYQAGNMFLIKNIIKRIEAIQFTMNHDDGNLIDDIKQSDIILLGVSRTSKTPTSIYLANRGYKTSNIPLINQNSLPNIIKKKS